MSILAFDFPVKEKIQRSDFIAQAIAWVKGMENSRLFQGGSHLEEFDGEASIANQYGETLTLREVAFLDGSAIGLRYDSEDGRNRLWRTELTLTKRENISVLRVRSQCIPLDDDAKLETPKKPFFVKMALDDGWGGLDGSIEVAASPIRVTPENEIAANEVFNFNRKSRLPFIYISIDRKNKYSLSSKSIDALSYQLGGIAHVVIEEGGLTADYVSGLTNGGYPHDGAIGIILPDLEIMKIFHDFRPFRRESDFLQAVIGTVSSYVTNLKSKSAIDYQDLSEEFLRKMKGKIKSGTAEFDSWLKSQENEIQERERENKRLSALVDGLQASLARFDTIDIFNRDALCELGQQIYQEEFRDRLLHALDLAKNLEGLDARTKLLVEDIRSRYSFSGKAGGLEERIKTAGKDSGKADLRLGEILTEIGFTKRPQKGHPVYVPANLFGFGNQTLCSTPSDTRSGKNSAAQIIRMLGLQNLK